MEKDKNNIEDREIVEKKNVKKTEEKDKTTTKTTRTKNTKNATKTTSQKKEVKKKDAKKSEEPKNKDEQKIKKEVKEDIPSTVENKKESSKKIVNSEERKNIVEETKEEHKEVGKLENGEIEKVIEIKGQPEIVKEEKKQEETKPNEPQENKQKGFQKIEKKKTKLPIIITTILICFLIIFSVIFALININNDKILSGISIMGIEVSGLKPEEAIKKLEEITQNKETEDMTLKHENYETTINGKQFSIKYDIKKAVNEAYNIGKDGNIITNNYEILFTQLFKKDIKIAVYYDEETLNSKLQDISSKIPGAVKQSSYYVEDEKLIIVKGTAGIKIKEKEIKEQIVNELEGLNNKNSIITIPVEETEPDDIDLAKIKSEIYKEPQDAYVSQNPTTVHPHVNGVDFGISIEEAQKLLESDKKEYEIPLKITVPKIKIKDLGEKAFPDQIATYTTRYDPSNYNRSNNLTIAANKIDGTVLMPGETFSYNKVVGARTIEAGYKAAGAYAGGRVVQDIGGGICQISSTIYNTALLANLEIVDRSNHQFLTSYVPNSRDATVSWGYLDFKFKNTRTYPIKIVASAKNGIAKVSMYGIKEKTEYTVDIQSKTLSYIPYSVKYIEDSSLAEGKEIVEQAGYNGCKSEAYRILKLNGQIISRTLLSRDTYDPMQKIVRRGTKKVTTTKPTTSTTKPATSNDQANNN